MLPNVAPMSFATIAFRSRVESRQQVNQICRSLAAQGMLWRGEDTCSQCGKNKLVNSAISITQPPLASQSPLRPLQVEEMFRILERFCQVVWGAYQNGVRRASLRSRLGNWKSKLLFPAILRLQCTRSDALGTTKYMVTTGGQIKRRWRRMPGRVSPSGQRRHSQVNGVRHGTPYTVMSAEALTTNLLGLDHRPAQAHAWSVIYAKRECL